MVGRSLFEPASFAPYDPTQEPIFPPELKLRHEELCGRSELFRSERMRWFRPATLGELLALKAEHPGAKIVVGNTELGVEMKNKKCTYPVMIQPSREGAHDAIHYLTISKFQLERVRKYAYILHGGDVIFAFCHPLPSNGRGHSNE